MTEWGYLAEPEAPWYLIDANDQKRMRLNLISHLLRQIPYRPVPIELPPFPALEGKPGKDKPKIEVRRVPDVA